MRKILITAALVASLGGCATAPVTTPVSVTNVVSEVQAIAQEVCGFLPVAQTILGIFSSGAFTSAAAVASAICSAVNQTPAAGRLGGRLRAGVGTPTVSGVPVVGRFVR